MVPKAVERMMCQVGEENTVVPLLPSSEMSEDLDIHYDKQIFVLSSLASTSWSGLCLPH